jgi:hypothetical protein
MKLAKTAPSTVPNIVNCHFRHFATPELTKAWERRKAYGEKKTAAG